ncbi:MAG TPA: HAD family hydrolase [Candidatus Saccharimonadales bacterium]|nr:HAD family hydrolase [Candidatus Saccharimonadales bacterium]
MAIGLDKPFIGGQDVVTTTNLKAVFLDKDGTLTPDVPYNADPAKVRLFPDTAASLKRLQAAGYRLIVISNQSGVARGKFGEKALTPLFLRLLELLEAEGVELDDIQYCPHHPEGTVRKYAVTCDCRKPMPGMLLRAAAAHHITVRDSWMVGDILHDVEAGNRAGCRSILIDNGNETEWQTGTFRTPAFRAPTLSQAVDFILTMQQEDVA